MRLKLTPVLFCLAWLTGCATAAAPVAYRSNPQWSEARNVMEAAGIHGMTDLPYAKYQEAKDVTLKKGMKLDTGPSLFGGATFGALNYISPPTGFSSGAAGVMGFASWLLIGSEHPGLYSRIFVWMPTDFAASPEEAQQRLNKLLRDAAETAIKETKWPARYTAYIKTYPKDTSHTPYLAISGGDCDKEYMRCQYGSLGAGLPHVDAAPAFLGGANAYVWHFIKYDRLFSLAVNQSKGRTINRDGSEPYKEWYAFFPDVEFFQDFTSYLPKWVYVYLAPQKYSFYDGTKYILPKYPIVINHGRVLQFIEPAPATAAR